MATVKSFENLVCWQKARELVKFVYDISKSFRYIDISKYQEVDRGLVDQIRRAAVSVMSNIAEGFDRGTKFELINYFYIAKGSCGEVRTQLYVAYDVRYIDMSTFRKGLDITNQCSRLIQSFIDKVKSGSRTGLQYKITKKKESNFAADWYRENDPELFEKYYNPKTGQIEFWRMAEDKEKNK